MSTGMSARIAANIEAELHRQCMSIEQLAYATGMIRETLTLRLDDAASFYTDELDAITGYLGIPIAALLR
jgi:lambda repressor-like predicted transcriptional regulator